MNNFEKHVKRWSLTPKPQRIEPNEGQESVWDYPRPPKLEKFTATIRIIHQDKELVKSKNSLKLMETAPLRRIMFLRKT